MSSVPTPDMSSDFYAGVLEPQPINPPRVVPMAPPRSVHSSTDDPFASPLAKVTKFFFVFIAHCKCSHKITISLAIQKKQNKKTPLIDKMYMDSSIILQKQSGRTTPRGVDGVLFDSRPNGVRMSRESGPRSSKESATRSSQVKLMLITDVCS